MEATFLEDVIMRKLVFIPLLLAMGCDPGSEPAAFGDGDLSALPVTAAGPPAITTVHTGSSLERGDTATLSAFDMIPGQPVYFLWSSAGLGTSCPPQLGGECLGLQGPVALIRSVNADLDGTARLTLTVPRSLGLSHIYTQAVALDSAGGHRISNTVDHTVYDLGTSPGPSCNIDHLSLSWPLPGADATDWVINNYVDLDDGSGVLDYLGGGKTYDGHRGIDIDVGSFREMDNDSPVVAAAAGTVIDTVDINDDRHTSCSGAWNVVEIEYDNGFRALYGHLKRDSVLVSVGQRVSPGDRLGVVGSSGCSTAPHLHYELRDCGGRVVPPFLNDLWTAPPVYATPLGVLDGMLRPGGISSVGEIKDPVDNPLAVDSNSTLGFGVSMAGGTTGDTFSVRLLRPNGTTHVNYDKPLTTTYRHHYWYWNPTVDGTLGTWTAQVLLNGSVAWTHTFEVVQGTATSTDQLIYWNQTASGYQTAFDDALAAGFAPVWVDVFSFGTEERYNAIFEPISSSFAAWHHASAATHQANITNWSAQGYEVVHVDGAMTAAGMLYTAIVTPVQHGWTAFHGQTSATHQSNFNTQVGSGMRAVNIAVGWTGSAANVTSLYDDQNVGGWVAWYGLDAAAYQTEFDSQLAAGRTLSYVDVYNDGVVRYSGIWNSVGWSTFFAIHNASEVDLDNSINTWLTSGLRVETISCTQGPSGALVCAASAAQR